LGHGRQPDELRRQHQPHHHLDDHRRHAGRAGRIGQHGTTTISITAANDAPVNGTVSSATGNENSDIPVTGLQVSDVDANPASATMTVTLSVTKGILTLRTNVASGLTAGNVSGNGTGSVTVTGTINAINATLAASNGLVFHGNTNVSGTDTLTVVTSDGGATGSGGAQSDTDGYTITIIGTNDAPTVGGDGTEVLGADQRGRQPREPDQHGLDPVQRPVQRWRHRRLRRGGRGRQRLYRRHGPVAVLERLGLDRTSARPRPRRPR
jgi:hypothetical protein